MHFLTPLLAYIGKNGTRDSFFRQVICHDCNVVKLSNLDRESLLHELVYLIHAWKRIILGNNWTPGPWFCCHPIRILLTRSPAASAPIRGSRTCEEKIPDTEMSSSLHNTCDDDIQPCQLCSPRRCIPRVTTFDTPKCHTKSNHIRHQRRPVRTA